MNLKVSHLILVVSLCCGLDGVLGDGPSEDLSKPKTVPSDKVQKLEPLKLVKTKITGQLAKTESAVAADTVIKSSSTITPPTTPHSTVVPPTTPHSTVTPPTSTTAPPVPDYKGNWVVYYNKSTSAVCIRLDGEIQLQVGYTNKTKNETGEGLIHIPKNANSTGNCANGTMVLSWDKNNSVTFDFNLDNKTNTWKLVKLSGNVQLTASFNKTNQTVPTSFHYNSTSIFSGHVDTSYLCVKTNSYNITSNSSVLNTTTTWAALTFSQLQLEAFKPESSNSSQFGSPNNCELTPDMVPIAVGCALAGLVVIVLVAYLIAQRKPPAQGYRSV